MRERGVSDCVLGFANVCVGLCPRLSEKQGVIELISKPLTHSKIKINIVYIWLGTIAQKVLATLSPEDDYGQSDTLKIKDNSPTL